jgi:hypothetical protein
MTSSCDPQKLELDPVHGSSGNQGHLFQDPGPPIAEPDYEPRIFGNPEQILEATFLLAGRDYGGPLHAARQRAH